MQWLPIEAAPTDGTWIWAIDKNHRQARIQSRRMHPKSELQCWFEGEEVTDGEWKVNRCFYPTHWVPIADA